jgi:hypothetical protein
MTVQRGFADALGDVTKQFFEQQAQLRAQQIQINQFNETVKQQEQERRVREQQLAFERIESANNQFASLGKWYETNAIYLDDDERSAFSTYMSDWQTAYGRFSVTGNVEDLQGFYGRYANGVLKTPDGADALTVGGAPLTVGSIVGNATRRKPEKDLENTLKSAFGEGIAAMFAAIIADPEATDEDRKWAQNAARSVLSGGAKPDLSGIFADGVQLRGWKPSRLLSSLQRFDPSRDVTGGAAWAAYQAFTAYGDGSQFGDPNDPNNPTRAEAQAYRQLKIYFGSERVLNRIQSYDTYLAESEREPGLSNQSVSAQTNALVQKLPYELKILGLNAEQVAVDIEQARRLNPLKIAEAELNLERLRIQIENDKELTPIQRQERLAALEQLRVQVQTARLQYDQMVATYDSTIRVINETNNAAAAEALAKVQLANLTVPQARVDFLARLAATGDIGISVLDGLRQQGLVSDDEYQSVLTQATEIQELTAAERRVRVATSLADVQAAETRLANNEIASESERTQTLNNMTQLGYAALPSINRLLALGPDRGGIDQETYDDLLEQMDAAQREIDSGRRARIAVSNQQVQDALRALEAAPIQDLQVRQGYITQIAAQGAPAKEILRQLYAQGKISRSELDYGLALSRRNQIDIDFEAADRKRADAEGQVKIWALAAASSNDAKAAIGALRSKNAKLFNETAALLGFTPNEFAQYLIDQAQKYQRQAKLDEEAKKEELRQTRAQTQLTTNQAALTLAQIKDLENRYEELKRENDRQFLIDKQNADTAAANARTARAQVDVQIKQMQQKNQQDTDTVKALSRNLTEARTQLKDNRATVVRLTSQINSNNVQIATLNSQLNLGTAEEKEARNRAIQALQAANKTMQDRIVLLDQEADRLEDDTRFYSDALTTAAGLPLPPRATPAPSTSAPGTPTPSTPAPSTSAPSTPAPGTPTPSTPAPSTSTPGTGKPQLDFSKPKPSETSNIQARRIEWRGWASILKNNQAPAAQRQDAANKLRDWCVRWLTYYGYKADVASIKNLSDYLLSLV